MHATASGTKRFFERRAGRKPAVLGRTGLNVSRFGIGSYRLNEYDDEHRRAIEEALRLGLNVIDTSANYIDGSSERLIGEALQDAFRREIVRRDEVVIITKAGFIQGAMLREAKQMKTRGVLWADTAEVQGDLWYCISPAFLADSITASLKRLQLESIDVLLLHNPETLLRSERKLPQHRERFQAKMEAAFRHLELEVERGRIRWFGVSSNTFTEPSSRVDHLSLADLDAAAGSSSDTTGHSHFSVVEFPLNLFESQAVLFPSQYLVRPNSDEPAPSALVPLIEAARTRELGVLTNRPFNAIRSGRLERLAAFPEHDAVEVKGDLHRLLGQLINLERDLLKIEKSPPESLQMSRVLRDRLPDLDDVLGWREALKNQIVPSVRSGLARLSPKADEWRERYEPMLGEALRLITADLETLGNQRVAMIAQALSEVAPHEKATGEPLSQRALRTYTGIPGVHTILVGMRRPEYVEDVMNSGVSYTAPEALAILDGLQRHKS